MKKYSLVLFIAIGFIACGKKEISTKKYYFPYASFVKPQVYLYADRKDTNAFMYWYFKTTVEKGDTIFSTCIFNSKLRPSNIYHNVISANGCNLREMLINISDSIEFKEYMVTQDEVFKWKIKPEEKIYVAFSMFNEQGEETEKVIAERNFEPKKELKTFNGKEYECLVAKDFVLLNQLKTNRTVTEEQYRTSYFAEGIGLLEFETSSIDGTSAYFDLKKIMNEADWLNLLANDSNAVHK